MKPIQGSLYILPVSRNVIFNQHIPVVQATLPPQAYGRVVAIADDNKIGVVEGDLVAYTFAAMTIFEADGDTYHVVPESQVMCVVEPAGV